MASNRKVLVMGGIIIDKYVLTDEFPQRGQDTLINDYFENVGGCAINVAYTLKNLNCMPYIVSVLGEDENGDRCSQYLEEKNLSTDCVYVEIEEKTGYCINIVEKGGERTFLTYKGAEAQFSEDLIPDQVLKNLSVIYLTGYYLVDGSYNEAIAAFLEKAGEAGVKIVFDPGPLIGKVDKETIYRVLQVTHVLIPNEAELEILEKMFVERKNFKEWCLKSGIAYIITKKGKEGAEVLGENIFFDQPAFPVSSIDSTGAGDSFAGGLIAGMLMGLDLDEAVIMAAACGAITTTLVEPHGDFDLKDIERLVIEHREEEESYD